LLNHPFLMGNANRKVERNATTLLVRSNSRHNSQDEPLLDEFERTARRPVTTCPVPAKVEVVTG
jgi:hypothetical protein